MKSRKREDTFGNKDTGLGRGASSGPYVFCDEAKVLFPSLLNDGLIRGKKEKECQSTDYLS